MLTEDKPAWSDIPNEIRDLFADLAQDVASLHVKWITYLDLFGAPDKIGVLNETGMAFFQTVEEALRMDMIMAFGRLLDRPQSMGRDNLSMGRLIDELKNRCEPAFHESLERQLKGIKDYCEPITKWRNRRVGHNDLETALEYHPEPLPHIGPSQIHNSLNMLAELMNEVERHYCKRETAYKHPILRGDAKDVIFYLEQGIEYEALRRDAAIGKLTRPDSL